MFKTSEGKDPKTILRPGGGKNQILKERKAASSPEEKRGAGRAEGEVLLRVIHVSGKAARKKNRLKREVKRQAKPERGKRSEAERGKQQTGWPKKGEDSRKFIRGPGGRSRRRRCANAGEFGIGHLTVER